MRILLIAADAQMHKFYLGGKVRSSREAPLSLSVLAALTAHRPDIHYQVVDESVDRVPLDADVDLVGISVLTGTAPRAYALADHFRSRGLPVVLGGVHVTLMPEEAARYADAIVVGMAEETWPRLLNDFEAGALKKIYREAEPTEAFIQVPTPRWEVMRKSGYMVPYTVMLTRGCVHKCDFCAVPGVWPRYQRRPIADIVRDVKAVPASNFAISDVSPFEDVEWSKELLRALAPLGKTWGGLATTRIADDPEMVDLLRKSGCRFLLIGFESIDQQGLARIRKGFNRSDRYRELTAKLRDAGIIVQGCFVFGFDTDTKDVFKNTVEQVLDMRVDIPRYSLYTPYPGSLLFERLESEGRILTYDWAKYDTMNVVIRPKNMTPVELYEGFRWAYRETFKLSNIVQRTIGAKSRFPIGFMGNVTYRLYVKRLDRSRGFEMPLPHAGKPEVTRRQALVNIEEECP